MERAAVEERLGRAMRRVLADDRHLLENNLSERCIAARLAFYLQAEFPDHAVDVEYNRKGGTPKRLALLEDCANFMNEDGEALAVPDVIVHVRGEAGPNVLALELKKSSNPTPRGCDALRLQALCDQLGYEFGASVECKTRRGEAPDVVIAEWFEPRGR
ncbi:MAG: hypothetical protein AB7H88_21295 [Vicinamibacterales bacterium]